MNDDRGATAQDVFRVLLAKHLRPWLKLRAFKVGGARTDFCRPDGEFETWIGLQRSHSSTKAEIHAWIHATVTHVPSDELVHTLWQDHDPPSAELRFKRAEMGIVALGVGESAFSAVAAGESAAAVADRAISDLERFLSLAEVLVADPDYATGAVAETARRPLTPYERAPVSYEAGVEEVVRLVLDGESAYRADALQHLGGSIVATGSDNEAARRDRWRTLPSAEMLAGRLVELCLDDPDRVVQLEAKMVIDILRLNARLSAAGSWWTATLSDRVTVDGRETDAAVGVTRATRPEAAAIKLGVTVDELSEVGFLPAPAPPPYPPGGAVWRHPDDLALPIWHLGYPEDWRRGTPR